MIEYSTPEDAHVVEPMPVRPAAIAAQDVAPAVLAQPEITEPVNGNPVDATVGSKPIWSMPVPMEPQQLPPVSNPPRPSRRLVDIATTPTASIEPTASAPDERSNQLRSNLAVPMFAESEPQATDNRGLRPSASKPLRSRPPWPTTSRCHRPCPRHRLACSTCCRTRR